MLYQFTAFVAAFLLLIADSYGAPIVWKIQTNKPDSTTLLTSEQDMMLDIKRQSKGQLDFVLKSAAGYVKPREAYNAVRTGEIDAMLMTPSYWAGANPVFAIMGDLVAAWNSPNQYLKWLNESGGIKHLERAYQSVGLKLLGYTVGSAESLVATKPIANVSDLQGLVMRSPPGMINQLFQLLGVKTRNIPAQKILESLKRNRIDMSDISDLAVNLQFGAYDIAKHTNFPGFHSMPLYDFVVRQQSWDQLTKQQQAIIKRAVTNWQRQSLASAGALQRKAVKGAKAKGVQLYRWDNDNLILVRKQAIKIWDQYAQKSSAASVLIKELKAWLKAEGNIR